MYRYGLIGKDIEYSFSRQYFNEKFKKEDIDAHYVNFDCKDAQALNELLTTDLETRGFNVTIPYKETVLPFMAEVDQHALAIGAINTIKRLSNGSLKGYNTDYIGFMEAIRPLLRKDHKKALILGTGGASKAVDYALRLLEIEPTYVSRNPKKNQLSYDELYAKVLGEYIVIVNCTPLGTFPNVDAAPPLPYPMLGKKHLLFDLVYNPAETKFLKLGKERGTMTSNGLKMLRLQAEAAWTIWN